MSNQLRRLISGARSATLDSTRLGVSSIEAWPAAGGGLLVGIAEPELAGVAPVRNSVKTVFLRIGTDGDMVVQLPYVRLELDGLECLRTLIATELGVSDIAIHVQDGEGNRALQMVDIGPSTELTLRCCAAAARALLAAAAVKSWCVAIERCGLADQLIADYVQAGRLRDLAADAALCQVPDHIELRGGRMIDLVQFPSHAVTDTKVSPIPSSK
jgi:isoquinoline 1-oxidoreductase beta subunit